MELHQIRHFVSVAETGSFTKGAQRAAVSQPALSASIAKLERELDVKLLDRRHQRVVLTKAGEVFLNTARSVLLACNSVKLELKKIRTPKALRLGVLRTLSSAKISKLLSAFRRAYPGIVIEVFDGSRVELAKRLGDRKLDLVLTSLDNSPASSQVIQLFFKGK
jgi:DNA-binding transcriptional LysR family regulator